MPIKSIVFSCLLTALCLGMISRPAYAYLDPGTGSMILQILLGGVAGAALAGRFYWDKLLTVIGIRSDKAASLRDDGRTGDNGSSQADR